MATTQVSNAVIVYDPDANRAVAKPEQSTRSQGGWALIRAALLNPTPGRTLGEVYTVVGKALEKQANRAAHGLGFGPHAVAQTIKSYFGKGDERVLRLELLRTSISPKLERRCEKLMRYTLPTESANTQCRAFREIVGLVTLFPGLRLLVLGSKCLRSATSTDKISSLWERSGSSPNEEWKFWQNFTATCLADTTISAILENSSIPELTNCGDEGLSVIERLLIEIDCLGSNFSSPLCIRYLGGLLDWPGFWSDMGSVHADITRKLCDKMVRILKDIGVDILALGPTEESEPPFDYDGVDFLTGTILSGISSWFSQLEQDWVFQIWFEAFRELLQLMRMPRSEALLPNTFNIATGSFDDILPTRYRDAELNIVVDGEDLAPETEGTAQDAHLADLNCENECTTSLGSNGVDPQDEDTKSSGSVQESLHDGGAQTHVSDMGFVDFQCQSEEETDNSSTVDWEDQDFISQMARLDFGPGEHIGHSLDIYEAPVRDKDIPINNLEPSSLGAMGLQHTPPIPPWKTLQLQAEELKIRDFAVATGSHPVAPEACGAGGTSNDVYHTQDEPPDATGSATG
ncbi:hypothetical protein B0H19DRAFT_1240943 [Mycena capillaripes]|nr:hypothetical protein B0H19DRAFT_1240943 [Mycena capillaripes]